MMMMMMMMVAACHLHSYLFITRSIIIFPIDNICLIVKNIGVLRDTARAPKPISQKYAIPCNGVIRYHKIPYHT